MTTRELVRKQEAKIKELETQIEAEMILIRHFKEENDNLKHSNPQVDEVNKNNVALLKQLTRSQIEISRLNRTVKEKQSLLDSQKNEYDIKVSQLTEELQRSRVSANSPGFSRISSDNCLPDAEAIQHMLNQIPDELKRQLLEKYAHETVNLALSRFIGLKELHSYQELVPLFTCRFELEMKNYLSSYFSLPRNKRLFGKKLFSSDEEDSIELVFIMAMAFVICNGGKAVNGAAFSIGEEVVQF